MKYEIVEMDSFSGNECKIYSIIPEGESLTLFETFISENSKENEIEINDILTRLETIGNHTGARHHFFKHEEGLYGDFVCALFDLPDKKLRLYCIRLGMVVVILGGGGEKQEGIRAWQEDEKLSAEATKMIDYSKDIFSRIEDRDLYWSSDKSELEGNMKNYDNE